MTPAIPLQAALFNSLGSRLVAFLLVALLPIGLIAVMQTRQVDQKASENAELAILALTEQAAMSKRFALERAFAASEALGAASPLFRADPALCAMYLDTFLAQNPAYRSVEFIHPSGDSGCADSGQTSTLTADPASASMAQNPRRIVTIDEAKAPGEALDILVHTPVQLEGDFVGYFKLAVKNEGLLAPSETVPASGFVALIALNGEGQVIGASRDRGDIALELPSQDNLQDLLQAKGTTLQATNATGDERVYAMTRVTEGTLYVLGVWDKNLTVTTTSIFPVTAFPLIMWLASLLVCVFAVHRLVIRHVRKLGLEMRRFAHDRTVPSDHDAYAMPAEMRKMTEDFHLMATSILQDEAALQESVREKKFLLKEVHHRVKNNLQLISSIVSMQIRRTPDAETKTALRRVQDRVLSLATIHRDLHESGEVAQVNAGKLLTEIVGHALEEDGRGTSVLQHETDIDDVWLYPDQAVPLSLLAAEASTNALSFVGAPSPEKPWFKVKFKELSDTECQLEISNSVPPDRANQGPGLGNQLIQAFAVQLNASLEPVETDQSFALLIRFKVSGLPEARDF